MNNRPKAIHLTTRGIIGLSGIDTKKFLQAIITNDIESLSKENPLYAAILTPQGKYLFDFIISQNQDQSIIYLDCELERIEQLITRLTMYKLRADVEIKNLSDELNVWSIINGEQGFVDPRSEELGRRLILEKNQEPAGDKGSIEDYDTHRLKLCVPDASRDIEVEKRPILEANYEKLNGVSFTKGCYVGQEVTARMQHRNAVRKHIYGISSNEPLDAFGEVIYAGDKKAGHLLSAKDKIGMALIKDEFVSDEIELTVNGKTIEVRQTNN